uniref:Immunoglobulin subtype domain-containing protein n=1 Tax=Sinocyclocheilus anshuiensis TaxID=1608454 RepID=A0A671PFC4_9TELE
MLKCDTANIVGSFNPVDLKNSARIFYNDQLTLDVLLPDAHQVMHQNKSSTEWKKVWKRDNKSRVNVAYSRLTDSDGTLTIKEFTSDDAGAYRVLGYEGEILITVTVTDEKSSVDLIVHFMLVMQSPIHFREPVLFGQIGSLNWFKKPIHRFLTSSSNNVSTHFFSNNSVPCCINEKFK